MSRRRVVHDRHCEKCGDLFHPLTAEINRGKGRFCSQACGRPVHPARPIADRFFDGIGRKTPSGCILWAKSVKNGWHGQIGSGGGPRKSKRMLVASRVAYELMVGPIPEGLGVLHRCDNPRCINPVHLFVGTQTDNMADMTAKGRQAKGEKCHNAKLDADKVREIRRRSAAGEVHRSIAKSLGISNASVTLIVHRQRWNHVA